LDGASDRDALLFPPSQQSIFSGYSIFRNRQDLEAHFRQIREAEFMCSSLRYIIASRTRSSESIFVATWQAGVRQNELHDISEGSSAI
jgi:hypothetical protein